MLNLETAVGREKDMQDIDVHSGIRKSVVTVTLLVLRMDALMSRSAWRRESVMSLFRMLLGASRACVDFRDPTAVSRLKLIALVPIIFLALNVHASKDKGIYLGGGFNLVSVGIKDPYSNTVNFKAGELLLGYKYNPYLGIEVRTGQSLQDETLELRSEGTTLTRTASAKIESYSSIYYRAELANEIAKVYLLLGQSNIETTLKFPVATNNRTAKDSGLSYGVGFGLWLDERMNLNFEIKTLVKTDSDSFTSGGISADYRF